MHPLLQHNDVVLVNPHTAPKAGNVVLTRHPLRRDVVLVKRLDHITEDGRLYLLGDNPSESESTDSRAYGSVNADLFLGRVVARLTRSVHTC